MTADRPVLAPDEQVQFGSYEAIFLEGEGARDLVIALTGVGDVSKPFAGYDFLRTLQLRPRLDRILIRDHARSWYRAPEGRAAMIAWCRQRAAAGRYRSVTLIGISMGAYAALTLGAEMPEVRIVALSPPFSLDTPRFGRGVVRYKVWLDRHPPVEGTDAVLTGDPARYLLLFGDEEMIDLYNLRLFQERGWPGLFLCPGGEHNLGSFLARHQRMGRVLDLAGAGAPMAELAAAAGALAVFPECHGLQMLAAREALWRGETTLADQALAEARAAVGAASPALDRLDWLRAGLLADATRALRRVQALPPARRVSLALASGGLLHLQAPEARIIQGVPVLGPLVLARLEHPGAQRLTLSCRAEVPARRNAGGRVTLDAFALEGNRALPLASGAPPAAGIAIPLTLREGAADFLLRRRCFSSGFDAVRDADQTVWSMKLRDIRLEDA
ncbi:hypothetical protein [Roseomonas sp. USHLN139]|uniref:hypothetical protein n=1 Tax=Roseomonas sp. USHLN139 TaxID=3081298 RepID=UPI003B029768